ncbi:WXG100 family type VII secretion target, partial [Micromonospora coerulea]|uniref:WXG100 family type VII secretion target n=1 Tax=Micromonospora coerulea TaxID=47856 RepID=UPI003D1565B1
MADWEQMAREVLVAGRPDKVQSAALGWKELLDNVGQVQESLQRNVKDLGAVWKGPAYEAFKSHVEALAKQAGGLVDAAEKPGRDRVSIVTNLETAARQLQAAQDSMPIPAACVGDVLAARNGEVVLGVGLFETRVKADLMGSWPMEKIGELSDWVSGWFSDQEGDARKVYNEVNGNYQDRVMESPSGGPSGSVTNPRPDIPNLGTGPGTGGGGGVPELGGTPSTGGLGGGPSGSAGKMPGLGSGGPNVGPSAHPDLTSGGGYPPSTGTGYTPSTGTGYPPSTGTGGDYGTGLAGAGTATAPGLGSGGGLPGGTGLGGSAGGLGGGAGLAGGAGIGRAVSPGLPPMMGGGGMAGAGGRGAGGRTGGGKLGAGGKLGGGGMAPGMGGGMAGAGGRG